MKKGIELKINGDNYEVLISPNNTLLEVLRDKLGLMGTKQGCDLGACGACTVLINGEAYLSCIMLAMDAVGKEIMTIEGIEEDGLLHPLQTAFVEKGGLQCGFCTPGMILTAKTILDEEEHPTEDTIKKKMSGNLCRCTGYKKIVEAVMSVSEQTGEGA
ncbi:MAG: (2Fe-2S)-binding protein [Deltaproteobacteria bacterium]|uniref:(2Fe-2S)-binding protein n=1 Tax=Candidatus Desulfacyla euxinica TaxID=2841693 RepID=A0A8J6T5V7_9DELT|nr:(2Fe-2S)-binding protein [Candidatus Desulfacyla euxinica]